MPSAPDRPRLPVPAATLAVRGADDSADAPAHAGWLIIAAFFGVLGAWALLAPLDGAVVAEAVVKSEGNRKTIQHLEGGIVSALNVKEGDEVGAGDTLMVLDATQARSELEALDRLGVVLLLTEARLGAEQRGEQVDRGPSRQAGSEVVPLPPALSARSREPLVVAAWRGQHSELEARRRESAGQSDIVRQRIAQLEAQGAGSRALLDGLLSQRASAKQELDSLVPLLAQGIVTRPRLLQLERSVAALDGQIGETRAAIARAEQAVGEQRQLELQGRNQRATQIGQELRDVQMRLADVLPKLANARAVAERTMIRSPYRGRVVGLSVFAIGAVIGRGERLMDIVPDDAALVIEARIAVGDVAEVRAGGAAEVRLTGFKQQVLPALAGEVVAVSADRLTDSRSGAPYYVATVRIDERELAAHPALKLQPGMAATAMIRTSSRTAFQYLTGPLWAAFDTALRER